jgi:hypothetical protein
MIRRTGRLTWCLTVAAAILTASCGRLVDVATEPSTLRVDLSDAGRTFTIEPGDHLVLTLSPGKGFRAVEWKLLNYPDRVLELLAGDSERGRFEFVAREPGEGEVQLSSGPRCEGPLPAAMTDRCPLGGSGEQSTTGSAAIPVVLFSITVRVR